MPQGRHRASLRHLERAAASLSGSRARGTAVTELTIDALLAAAYCLEQFGCFGEGRGHALAALRSAGALLPAGDRGRIAHAALLDGLGRHAESIPVYRRAGEKMENDSLAISGYPVRSADS
jgi:hypothetical protein